MHTLLTETNQPTTQIQRDSPARHDAIRHTPFSMAQTASLAPGKEAPFLISGTGSRHAEVGMQKFTSSPDLEERSASCPGRLSYFNHAAVSEPQMEQPSPVAILFDCQCERRGRWGSMGVHAEPCHSSGWNGVILRLRHSFPMASVAQIDSDGWERTLASFFTLLMTLLELATPYNFQWFTKSLLILLQEPGTKRS